MVTYALGTLFLVAFVHTAMSRAPALRPTLRQERRKTSEVGSGQCQRIRLHASTARMVLWSRNERRVTRRTPSRQSANAGADSDVALKRPRRPSAARARTRIRPPNSPDSRTGRGAWPA